MAGKKSPKKSGGLRFTERETLDWHYRQKFLLYTETEAPEVLESLKSLCPKFQAVINGYPYANHLTDWLSGFDGLYGQSDPRIVEGFKREMLNYHLAVRDRYNLTDPTSMPEAEEEAWLKALDLRSSYRAFIERFGLTTEWLRRGLFQLIADLNRSPRHFNSLCYVYSHAYLPVHGEEIEFDIFGWKVEESWAEFEKRAREKLEYELRIYKRDTIQQFKRWGYKEATKPLSFESVKWLVWWTVKRLSKKEILERIDSEHNQEGKTYDLKTLEYHFRRLKQYELPVRPGSKSIPEKSV